MKRRSGLRMAAALFAAAIGGAWSGAAEAGTMDRLKQDKAIRIAFREDAPPFSFKDDKGQPAGFMVELCRDVAKGLSDQLGGGALDTRFVPVTATTRFDAIENGQADLLCEATTATLSRRAHVDFSIATYVDGASVLVRTDGPIDFAALKGRKIGVLAGTTTQEELDNSLQDAGITAEVVPVTSHAEGLAMLDRAAISAYFADRAILAFLASRSAAPQNLALANNFLTVEPYALALPRGDQDFRLAVDRALSRIYRSDEINQVFKRSFGTSVAGAQGSGLLQTLYTISALPE